MLSSSVQTVFAERLTIEEAEFERRKERSEKTSTYSTLFTLSPQDESEWRKAARRLGEAGKFAELDAILADARDIFPLSHTLAEEYAKVAVQGGDADEAARRWEEVTRRFPAQPLAYAGLCAALNELRRFDEADRLSTGLIEQFSTYLPIFLEYARTADLRRDGTEALRRWRLVSERFPGIAGHFGVAMTLLHQRRLDEADLLFHQALQVFPRQRQLLEAAATVAQLRRDWPEAIARWDEVLTWVPDSVLGHEERVIALRAAGRIDEAEAAVAAARERFPQSVRLAEEQAHLAVARSDWETAIEAWRVVRKGSPYAAQAALRIADLLVREKQYQEADIFLEEELSRFPDSADVAIRHAEVAKRSQNWSEALRRWSLLEARFPNDRRIPISHAETLWMMRDLPAFIQAVDRLQARHADQIGTAILYGLSLLCQNRATDAVAHLTAATARWPGNAGILSLSNSARMQALLELDEEVACTPPRQASAPSEQDVALEPRKLFEQFESLGGDSRGCEFGLLQRRFGAEPLGLTRWVSIAPRGLIEMLERRFEGLGDVVQTSVRLDPGQEYRLIDSQYEMDMHTFITAGIESQETLFVKLSRRQRYLARELIENLEEAHQIFVYKTETPMVADQMKRLWRAIRSYGDNTLLLVRLADSHLPSGSLEVVDDGLIVGAIDNFSTFDISVDAWTKLCTAAIKARNLARNTRGSA